MDMSDDALPEADCLDGAPHPRMASRLFGQTEAEETFLSALNSGRLPHGWLLTGPRGVGKATFAWRAARYLLANPPDEGDGLFGAPPPPVSLDTDPEHPVARRLRALSEPNLLLLRRPWDFEKKRLKTQLTVDEVRGLKGFFHMSGGARRVVIVDAADEMNPSAANALLKELEEPPKGAVLFLVSHRPSGLLPTIRSRCRTLRFSGLAPADLAAALAQADIAPDGDMAALTTLAAGSVGDAIRLAQLDGARLYADLVKLASGLPDMDRPLALRLADAAAGKSEDRFDLTLTLLDTLLARAARLGATGIPPTEIVAGEAKALTRLAPTPVHARAWADLAQSLSARARAGKAVNLDPAALVFDMFLDMDRTAARLAA